MGATVSTGRRILYLPVETTARELAGKVLLAAMATERGWLVVIRDWHKISQWIASRPAGAVVAISIPEDTAGRIRSFRRAGHRVINICEENIVYPDGRDYCHRKVGPSALAALDLMMVSGARNYAHLQEFRPEGTDKYRVTGNPRFDTLLPGFRAAYERHSDDLRKRFGRFLLVNTNFSRINPFKSHTDVFAEMSARDQFADDSHASFYREHIAYKARQAAALKDALIEIAAARVFDTIVLRPHPSENQNTWRQWANPLGIEVHYDLTANDWMVASDAVLHTGCTTGIEGLLLDRPVASFVPEHGSKMLNQADEVSHHAASADAFLALYASWRGLTKTELRAAFGEQRSHLGSLIANQPAPLASDRIMEAIDQLDVADAPPDFGRTSSARERVGDAIAGIQAAVEGLRSRSHHRQKFPGISDVDVRTPIETWVRQGVLARAPRISRLPGDAWLFSADDR